MRPLCRRTVFLFSSSSSSPFPSPLFVQISHFSTSQKYSSGSCAVSPYRRPEVESKNVRVSVWWDFENCGVPNGVNVFKVAQHISAAVRTNGIKGSIQITAFGDVAQLSRSNQEALSATGINLNHVPRGKKNSADRSLLVDLMFWVSQNPPPAHLFLISGDKDFANILHRLRMNNYNVLLASTEEAPGVLCSAATIMWRWQALVRGQGLAGKHFNQPPDGPYSSWYGHYKAPLEDPLSGLEKPACSQTKESSESGSDSTIHSVPKMVLKQIRKILNLYPEGISMTDLHSELGKTNVGLDKDLYGYKKFSCFLLSMPHILNLEHVGRGHYMVRGSCSKAIEPVQLNSASSTESVTDSGENDITTTPSLYDSDNSISEPIDQKNIHQNLTTTKLSSVDGSCMGAVDGKKLFSTPKVEVEKPSSEELVCSKEEQEASQPGKKVVEVVDEQLIENLLPSVDRQVSSPKVGALQKIRRWWFGDGSSERTHEESLTLDSSEKANQSTATKFSSSGDISGETEGEEKCLKSTNQDVEAGHPLSSSSLNIVSVGDTKAASSPEPYKDGYVRNLGFFNRIVKWCCFLKSGDKSDMLIDESSERLNQINERSGENELLTKDSFWLGMEAFMDTPRGSVVVSQSMTREELAQNLQKEGPSDLSSASEGDLLCLVDLLISEKKWVEECPSQRLPFKLLRTIGNSTCVDHPCSSNGLSDLFLNQSSSSGSRRRPEYDGEKKNQNFPRTLVSRTVIGMKPLNRSKSDILADCQELVNEILKEYPEGYNIGCFRKRFHDRYGYFFDLQELGYKKLASLFETMPGVKIESTYIFPSGNASDDYCHEKAVPDVQENNACKKVANSDSDLSDVWKHDKFGSPWEELGPVANTSESELKSVLEAGVEAIEREAGTDFEPSLSDDSDSEEDMSTASATVGQVKKPSGVLDSSLLQILDSWYSNTEGENRKSKQEIVDGMVDCSKNGSKPSDLLEVDMPETSEGSYDYDRKLKPWKTYSFVADPVNVNKDKLIDGILGSLKKSNESRMHS